MIQCAQKTIQQGQAGIAIQESVGFMGYAEFWFDMLQQQGCFRSTDMIKNRHPKDWYCLS